MSEGDAAKQGFLHRVSIVVPVYRGATTLPDLMREIETLTRNSLTPRGHDFIVFEVLLVYDHGPDSSAEVMRSLERQYDFVRTLWLSRNYGQHAATLAGIASTGGDWIVTLDEDGQHDPAYIPDFIDSALEGGSDLVYGRPTNVAPHGLLRNLASKSTKWIFNRMMTGKPTVPFQSYRLILGEIGRSVAAYAGAGVFLDVAIGWVSGATTSCDIELRHTSDRPSGYSYRKLLSHFWRMVLSSGTRALRVVSLMGVVLAVIGILLAVGISVARLLGGAEVQGWASVIVTVLITGGAVLFSLGVIAEYVGVAVNMAMGKPLYLIISDPAHGPLQPSETLGTHSQPQLLPAPGPRRAR